MLDDLNTNKNILGLHLCIDKVQPDQPAIEKVVNISIIENFPSCLKKTYKKHYQTNDISTCSKKLLLTVSSICFHSFFNVYKASVRGLTNAKRFVCNVFLFAGVLFNGPVFKVRDECSLDFLSSLHCTCQDLY